MNPHNPTLLDGKEFWVDDVTGRVCGPWSEAKDMSWPDNEKVLHVIEHHCFALAMYKVKTLEYYLSTKGTQGLIDSLKDMNERNSALIKAHDELVSILKPMQDLCKKIEPEMTKMANRNASLEALLEAPQNEALKALADENALLRRKLTTAIQQRDKCLDLSEPDDTERDLYNLDLEAVK